MLSTPTPRGPVMRGALLAVALILVGGAGCLGPPTVRVAKITESFAFDERAPAEAAQHLDFRGCAGNFDPESGRLRLVRERDTQPTFVMLVERGANSTGPAGLPDPRAGETWPMAAGAGGGFPPIPAFHRWMNERGSGGGWGHGAPFQTVGQVEMKLWWDRDGATFEGETLREGEVVRRTFTHEVTQFNATFTVVQRVEATYLGRVPYSLVASCEEAP